MKLIPFDLGKALTGAEVRTRDGRKVTGLRLVEAFRFPVRAVFNDREYSFTANGEWINNNVSSSLDLFLVAPPSKQSSLAAPLRGTRARFTPERRAYE